MSAEHAYDRSYEDPFPLLNPLKVLVVDDEEGFRNLLRWELNNRGIHVETAEDGFQGVQMAEKTQFDVIITDVTMPIMNGLTLLERIKEISPETEVIVTTGFGVVETAVHAMKNGAFDFVLKPYDLDHLVARVRQAVERLSHCRQCGRLNHE